MIIWKYHQIRQENCRILLILWVKLPFFVSEYFLNSEKKLVSLRAGCWGGEDENGNEDDYMLQRFLVFFSIGGVMKFCAGIGKPGDHK